MSRGLTKSEAWDLYTESMKEVLQFVYPIKDGDCITISINLSDEDASYLLDLFLLVDSYKLVYLKFTLKEAFVRTSYGDYKRIKLSIPIKFVHQLVAKDFMIDVLIEEIDELGLKSKKRVSGFIFKIPVPNQNLVELDDLEIY